MVIERDTMGKKEL